MASLRLLNRAHVFLTTSSATFLPKDLGFEILDRARQELPEEEGSPVTAHKYGIVCTSWAKRAKSQ